MQDVSSYDHVVTSSTLKKILNEDPDLKFLLEVPTNLFHVNRQFS